MLGLGSTAARAASRSAAQAETFDSRTDATGDGEADPAVLPTDGAVSEWSSFAALSPDALFDDKELALCAGRALGGLRGRQASFITAWLEGDDGRPATHAAIAKSLGVSRSRVHQALQRALRALRRAARVGALVPFQFPDAPRVLFVPARERGTKHRGPTLYERIGFFGTDLRWLFCECGTAWRPEPAPDAEIARRAQAGDLRCRCGLRPESFLTGGRYVFQRWWTLGDRDRTRIDPAFPERLRDRDLPEPAAPRADAEGAEPWGEGTRPPERTSVPVRREPMVRKRPMARNPNFDSLSRDEIVLAVRDLVSRGVVSAADVRDAAGRANRIAALEAELASLRGGAAAPRGPGRPRGAGRPAKTGAVAPAPKPKRKITNTPQRLAAMRRQGQYLGALNKLSGPDRLRVKALAKKEGVPAALALAARLLG